MKKIILIIFIFICLLSITSCDNDTNSTTNQINNSTNNQSEIIYTFKDVEIQNPIYRFLLRNGTILKPRKYIVDIKFTSTNSNMNYEYSDVILIDKRIMYSRAILKHKDEEYESDLLTIHKSKHLGLSYTKLLPESNSNADTDKFILNFNNINYYTYRYQDKDCSGHIETDNLIQDDLPYKNIVNSGVIASQLEYTKDEDWLVQKNPYIITMDNENLNVLDTKLKATQATLNLEMKLSGVIDDVEGLIEYKIEVTSDCEINYNLSDETYNKFYPD